MSLCPCDLALEWICVDCRGVSCNWSKQQEAVRKAMITILDNSSDECMDVHVFDCDLSEGQNMDTGETTSAGLYATTRLPGEIRKQCGANCNEL